MTPWKPHFTIGAATIALTLTLSSALLRAQQKPEPPTVKALIAVLQSDAATFDKARACQQLTALGDKEAVPALAALLSDEKLASHARSALESIADPSAAAALREALGRVQGKLLAGVVNSLGIRRDAEAVAPLRNLAKDQASGVADEALIALGRIATPEAIAVLRQALATGSAENRMAAADACLVCAERLLAQGQRAEAIGLLEQVRLAEVPKHVRAAAVHSAILARPSGDLSFFVSQLKSEEPVLFTAALRASRHLQGREATQALLTAWEQLPAARQVLAIGALVERHDASVLPLVQRAAAAGPQEVRLAALAALAQMGDAPTTRLLIDTSLAEDAALAQAARDSLLRTRVEGVDGLLTTRLEQASSHERIVLLDLLGQRGVAAATAAVVKLVGDPADELRVAAIRALGRVGSAEQFPVLLGCLQAANTPQETAVVQDAMRALSSRATEPDAYAGKLRDCLPQASLTSQCFVLELIGQVGGREALTIVAAHARDARPEIQDAATRALGNGMSVDAAPVLLDLAKTLRDAKLKTRALRGYLRIARQLDLPIDRRLEMCEEAFALAERDEEKRLAAETADAIVQRSGSAAQKARGKALSAKVPH